MNILLNNLGGKKLIHNAFHESIIGTPSIMYDEYVQNDLLLISISFLFAVVVVSEICGVVGPSMIVSHAVELLEVMTTLALPLHLQEKHVAYN